MADDEGRRYPRHVAIPHVPMEKGATTVVRTGGRIFRYETRYSQGVAITEKNRSSHLTRDRAERAARRFVKPDATGEVVRRFGADRSTDDDMAYPALTTDGVS